MKNPSIKTKVYHTQSEYNYLNQFSDKIILLRKSLFRFAKELPSPLNEHLVIHYQKRLELASSSPMLGEYAVFLISDLFNIPSNNIDQLAFPWLLLYHYCLMLDDILDNPQQNNYHTLLTSQLLFQSAIKEYNKIFHDNNSLWESFDNCYRQWFDAMLFELQQDLSHKNKINGINYLQQGRKAALVKFCANSLFLLFKKRQLNNEESECLDNLCCGIQLLDDITDIEYDYGMGVSNTLTLQIKKWLSQTHSSSTVNIAELTNSQLKIALLFSGAISSSLKTSIHYLNHGLTLSQNSKSITSAYFNQIIEKCVNNNILIEKLLEDVSNDKVNILLKNELWTENNIYHIESVKIKTIWENINSIIYNTPKACN